MCERLLIAILCLFSIAPLARANIITFGDISAGDPAIVVGNGTINESAKPVGVPISHGYAILDFSYMVTATQLANIQVDWLSNRKFSTNADSDITVSIGGEVSVDMTGGRMGFQVAGLIDSNFNPTVLFNSDPVMGAVSDARIRWNMEKTKDNVAQGDNHTLEMFTSLGWFPAAVGDTLTISSFIYSVEATAAATGMPIPEPGSLLMLTTGLLALSCHRSRKRMLSQSERLLAQKVKRVRPLL